MGQGRFVPFQMRELRKDEYVSFKNFHCMLLNFTFRNSDLF